MAICVRNKCNKRVSNMLDAREKRLCDAHFRSYIGNKERRSKDTRRVCHYCGVSLVGKKNKKYCNVKHRQLGSRKLIGKLIEDILHYSYWRHIESAIRRSPLQLGSISEINDIIELFRLYVRKGYHQRSYLLIPMGMDSAKEINKLKPFPFLELEVCHTYPNGRGGANTASNTIIGPLKINRMVKDKIPCQDLGYPYSGLQLHREPVPLQGSLYNSLVATYGSQEVNEKLYSLGKISRFFPNRSRQPEFNGMAKELPLLMLLFEEFRRLEMITEAERLHELSLDYRSMFPLYLELVAICGFYAFLTGDRERFLQRLFRHISGNIYNRRWYNRSRHERVLYLLLRKHLKLFFNVKIEDYMALADFYNSFFTMEVVSCDPFGELTSYSYSMGNRRVSMTVQLIHTEHMHPNLASEDGWINMLFV